MKYLNRPSNTTKCPICNEGQSILRYVINAKECARHFILTTNENGLEKALDEKIIELWGKNNAEILTCKNCSFTYANPFIAGNSDFYNLVNHSEETSANPTFEWEFILSQKDIKKKNKTNPILLEIGASDGNFVKGILDKQIKKENIYCSEFSEIGTKQLNALGVNTFSTDFRTFNKDISFKNKFDYICLFQVLEHLDGYDQVFDTFDYISNPNAHIYIAVPNGERITFNEKNKALLDLPPNHIGRFNQKSVYALAQKYHWQVEAFEIQKQSKEQIFAEMLYFRSVRRRIENVEFTISKKIITYLETNLLKIKIKQQQQNIGDNIWFCLKRKN